MDQDLINTYIFDCDGVILNSNKVKTNAFYNAGLTYGQKKAELLKKYHVENGGISRYLKFEYFLRDIVQKDFCADEIEILLTKFGDEVKKGLLASNVAEGLKEFRDKTRGSRWMIVSGGDQKELREVFEQRGLIEMFDGGVFGSPATKEEILEREMLNHNIIMPALLFGDSKYDHFAAVCAGIDFMFVSNWTEVDEWMSWTAQNNINYIHQLSDFLSQ